MSAIRYMLLAVLLLASGCAVAPAAAPQGGVHNAAGIPSLTAAEPAELARLLENSLTARKVDDLRALASTRTLTVCVYHGPCHPQSSEEALSHLSEVLGNAQSVHVEVVTPGAAPAGLAAGTLGEVNLRVRVQPLVTPDPTSGVFYYDTLLALRMTDAGWSWFAWHLRAGDAR